LADLVAGSLPTQVVTQFYLPRLPPTHLASNGSYHSVSIHQMAPTERGSAHAITAHYSFIDLERMKG